MASKRSNIPKFNFSEKLHVKTVEIQNSGGVNQGKIIIDYYMAIFISHVTSTRDAHN